MILHQHQSVLPNYLVDEFKNCTRLQYSGKLEIKSLNHKWTFYYRLGRIVWAGGGMHPGRRCRRTIAVHCPLINIDKIQLPTEILALEHWDYLLLEILYKKNKITQEQVNAIVDSTISELLFDLAQYANFLDVNCQRNQDTILDAPMSLTSTEVCLRKMHDLWESWSEAGLANFSPNLAPILRQPEQLIAIVSPTTYNKFVKLMKGKYTLRDLAVQRKQDLLSITRSLLPYILSGIIELVKISDFTLEAQEIQSNLTISQLLKQNTPSIACVGNNPLVRKILENTVSANGMKFISIQNLTTIIPTLIEKKPDIIFLDLIMPVASSYEICTQIRRISLFAKTPVIILTESDGIFDRLRAKVVGSNDFISKPLNVDTIMNMIHKYMYHSDPDWSNNIEFSYA